MEHCDLPDDFDLWDWPRQRAFYAEREKAEHDERTFFVRTLAPSPFHWHFHQSQAAIKSGLYLPGLSGLLNALEASLRTTLTVAQGRSLEGDLGETMSASLLKNALDAGMPIAQLAFPDEADFLDRVKLSRKAARTKPVKLVRLRHDICHGNTFDFHQNPPGVGEFFTPECLRPVSEQLLTISKNWAGELQKFLRQHPAFAMSEENRGE